MELALLEKVKLLQNDINDIEKQNVICTEVSKLILNPNVNFFNVLFHSQQTHPGQLKFIIFFIKNKISHFKKQFGDSFFEEVFNEISNFLLESVNSQHEPFLSQSPLENTLKLVVDMRYLLEKVLLEVNDLFIIQIVQTGLDVLEKNFWRRSDPPEINCKEAPQQASPLSLLQSIWLQKVCILAETCLAKLQKQDKIFFPHLLQNSQMTLLIRLVPKLSENRLLLDAVFCLMKRVLRFAFKEDKSVDQGPSAVERMKSFLKLNELFSLKEIFFRTEATKTENLLLKTHVLELFARIISNHHKLGFVRHNEYLGIFKNGFTSSVGIIKTRIIGQKQLLLAPEQKFLRSFIRFFHLIVKTNVPMDTQIFESRNELVNFFFFPLLTADEKEQEYSAENPMELVHYAQDLIDKKRSKTLKCEVFRLFEMLSERSDGFLVFVSEYLSNVILYTGYFVLFNHAQHSRLESIYDDSQSNAFVRSIRSLFPVPKSHFEQSLLQFLGEDSSTKYTFNSVLMVKQFYEERGRGNRNSYLRSLPQDIHGE